MGFIAGSDGKSFTTFGGVASSSDGSTYVRNQFGISGPKGHTSVMGNLANLSGNRGTITRLGNTWHGPNGTYTLSGGMLIGPGCKHWSGVSPEDVNIIIDSDTERRW